MQSEQQLQTKWVCEKCFSSSFSPCGCIANLNVCQNCDYDIRSDRNCNCPPQRWKNWFRDASSLSKGPQYMMGRTDLVRPPAAVSFCLPDTFLQQEIPMILLKCSYLLSITPTKLLERNPEFPSLPYFKKLATVAELLRKPLKKLRPVNRSQNGDLTIPEHNVCCFCEYSCATKPWWLVIGYLLNTAFDNNAFILCGDCYQSEIQTGYIICNGTVDILVDRVYPMIEVSKLPGDFFKPIASPASVPLEATQPVRVEQVYSSIHSEQENVAAPDELENPNQESESNFSSVEIVDEEDEPDSRSIDESYVPSQFTQVSAHKQSSSSSFHDDLSVEEAIHEIEKSSEIEVLPTLRPKKANKRLIDEVEDLVQLEPKKQKLQITTSVLLSKMRYSTSQIGPRNLESGIQAHVYSLENSGIQFVVKYAGYQMQFETATDFSSVKAKEIAEMFDYLSSSEEALTTKNVEKMILYCMYASRLALPTKTEGYLDRILSELSHTTSHKQIYEVLKDFHKHAFAPRQKNLENIVLAYAKVQYMILAPDTKSDAAKASKFSAKVRAARSAQGGPHSSVNKFVQILKYITTNTCLVRLLLGLSQSNFLSAVTICMEYQKRNPNEICILTLAQQETKLLRYGAKAQSFQTILFEHVGLLQ